MEHVSNIDCFDGETFFFGECFLERTVAYYVLQPTILTVHAQIRIK